MKYHAENNSREINPQLSSLINFPQKTISSATGQIIWDYKKGTCLLDAPAAQGVCGFVGQDGIFNLSDVKIVTQNDYAVINVVSMDKNPIAHSGKILIQTGTVYHPSGWSETPSSFIYNNINYQGFLINNTGRMPWKSIATKASVSIRNRFITSVKLLDVAGYPIKELAFSRNGDWVTVELPYDAMYVVLQGEITGSASIKKKDPAIKVYPNPAQTFVNIECEKQTGELSVRIFTPDGTCVRASKNTIRSTLTRIDVSDLTPGLYFIEVFLDKMPVEVHKFIKN